MGDRGGFYKKTKSFILKILFCNSNLPYPLFAKEGGKSLILPQSL